MTQKDHRLDIAEVPFETGDVQFRYARYLAPDGKSWIRHGLFIQYHRDGTVAAEGQYVHGHEHGVWKSFHANGALAVEGRFDDGNQVGVWRYWNEDGIEETSETFSRHAG